MSTEKEQYHGFPSAKVIIPWLFGRVSIVFFIGLWFGVGSLQVYENLSFSKIFVNVIGFLILAGLVILAYLIFLCKTYRYTITDKGIYFKGGIIVRSNKFVPFFKVTDVEVSQNLLEQILGINKLKFHTAGSMHMKPEIMFEGIVDATTPRDVAHKMIVKSTKGGKYSE